MSDRVWQIGDTLHAEIDDAAQAFADWPPFDDDTGGAQFAAQVVREAAGACGARGGLPEDGTPATRNPAGVFLYGLFSLFHTPDLPAFRAAMIRVAGLAMRAAMWADRQQARQHAEAAGKGEPPR